MNTKLLGMACRKFAEGFAMLEEGLTQGQEVTSATTAAPAPEKTDAGKKARKSPAAKAAPAPEVEEEEIGVDEEVDEEGEDDLDGVEDEGEGEDEAAPTRETIRELVVKYAKAKGKSKAYSLLEKFGAKNTKELKDKDLAKAHAAFTKALNA